MLSDARPVNVAGPRQGVVLSLGSVPAVMAVVALVPTMPALMQAFASVPNAIFWVPALLSVPGLCAAAFAPVAGYLGDRFNKRLLIVGFILAFCIVGVLPVFLSDFSMIVGTRVVVGACQSAVLVLSIALIGDYFSGDGRERWLSLQAMTATFSALAILPLSGVLGAWLGWRGPFLIYLSLIPLAFATWVLCWDSRSEERREAPVPWSALPWKWLMGFCIISMFASMMFYALQLHLGLALASVGITDSGRIGLLSGVSMIGIPVGAIVFMRFSHLPFAALLGAELFLCALTLMGLRYVDGPALFVALAFTNLAAGGAILPTLVTHISKNLEPAVRGRGIGVWQSAFSIGQFLCVACTSIIMKLGSVDVIGALSAFGLTALIMTGIGYFMSRRRDAGTTATVA